MPSFKVEHETKMSAQETFDKVCDYLQNSEGLKKLDSALKYDFDKAAKTGHVKGSKFECSMKVVGSPTKVVLDISIPLLLTPFKSTIENNLKEKMSKILG